MSGEKKKSSSPTDTAQQLQTSITNVRTLPTGRYKATESLKGDKPTKVKSNSK